VNRAERRRALRTTHKAALAGQAEMLAAEVQRQQAGLATRIVEAFKVVEWRWRFAWFWSQIALAASLQTCEDGEHNAKDTAS